MNSGAASHSHSVVGRSLLVTQDADLVEQVRAGLERFAITADACPDPSIAASLINTRKYEAIVVDMALGQEGAEVLGRVRCSPSNQNSVTFALAATDEPLPGSVGSHFIIPKPLTESSLNTTLRAALGLIIRDYRRYFRCPLTVPVLVQTGNGDFIACQMVNISEGGLAFSTQVEFHPGAPVAVEFELPAETEKFTFRGEVCWCDKKGRVGLHFESVPEEQKERLQAWLSRKIEEGIPEPVARLFQKQLERPDPPGF